jgi:hypothetical protein
MKKTNPTYVIYENTNYINSKGKGMTSLFKMFGVLELLSIPGIIKYPSSIEKFDNIPVDQVKSLRKRIFENKEKIPNLDYKVGRG